MEARLYNQEGEEKGSIKLSESIFGLKWNADLVHQVMLSMQSNARIPSAHVKDRSEVRGGGAKPWRQKGTGRARHGSTRSPIWVGGGVTHGPTKERNFEKKINKKMKKKALFVALSQKLRDNEILFLDDLKIEKPKTKEVSIVLSNLAKINNFEKLGQKRKNRAIVLVEKKQDDLKRAFSNIPGILFDEARNLNLLDALNHKYVVFTKDALKIQGQ
ncbi:MAG: 50S ribosomal protein L4 [Candidatus Pacebacteria bacterium]|nr:50S ribosomal protein L4 [Candidatus Paceibacterota bacterium]